MSKAKLNVPFAEPIASPSRDVRLIPLSRWRPQRAALEQLTAEAVLVERRQMRFPPHEALGATCRFRQFDRAETDHPNRGLRRMRRPPRIEMRIDDANHFLPRPKPKLGSSFERRRVSPQCPSPERNSDSQARLSLEFENTRWIRTRLVDQSQVVAALISN